MIMLKVWKSKGSAIIVNISTSVFQKYTDQHLWGPKQESQMWYNIYCATNMIWNVFSKNMFDWDMFLQI